MTDSRAWDAAFDVPATGFDDPEVAVRRVRRRRRSRDKGKRRDIQGLRMVAVVAVVINHLTGHPQGGFVGVDVFFVISGYLITGHLLREHVKSGTISLLDFYKRRIRRLFPAALTVILGTVLAAQFVFTTQRFHDTVTDGIWATLFGANWRFINVGTDYFAASGPVSPLQHYWSLSVEEQFYVVWPLAILTALFSASALARRRTGARSAAAFFAGALLTGASLVVAVIQSSSDPVIAYFSTFTRGWELGLGAVLAVLSQTKRLQRVSSRTLTTTISWVGLALILVSVFVVTESHFPFPGALLPCLGSALVIIGWSDRAPSRNFVLTNKLSNYLGDISYSIYVVHFPVIIFAGVLLTTSTLASNVAILLLALSLSMLLFHLIEDPIRKSKWLAPRRERGDYVTSNRLNGRSMLVGLASGVCSLAIFVLIPPTAPVQYDDILQAVQAAPTPSAGTTEPAPGSGAVEETAQEKANAFREQLRSALLVQSWPSLSPAMGEQVPTLNRKCGLSLMQPADCTWGSPTAKKVIYLVGDSTSVSYTQAFVSMIKYLPDWRVRTAGGDGCPFADRVIKEEGGHSAGCGERNDALVAEIKSVGPDIVVSTSAVRTQADTKWQSVLNELEKIKGSVGKIVMLPPNPMLPDPNTCDTKFSKPVDCVGQVESDYRDWLARNAAMAKTLQGTVIDPTSWFCLDGYCPAFVGTVPMRKDSIHITDQFAQLLGPLVLEAFQKNKLVESH